MAVTGAGGRLGSALVAELGSREVHMRAWRRPDYDLDEPTAAPRLLERDRPALVVHAAAWTDVDGCARDPERAMRRNATATGELATACAAAGAGLVVVSTNEVFDGRRADGVGYAESDATAPLNPYGASKLEGERLAAGAFAEAGRADGLWVVRTAWLYGPPGRDFPERILAAADRVPSGDSLPVVTDEVGSPTFAPDLAAALLDLVERTSGGTYHLVNEAAATRAEWAEAVLDRCREGRVPLRPISRTEYQRASTPPAWAVLDAARAGRAGIRLRPWRDALAEYLATLCPSVYSAA